MTKNEILSMASKSGFGEYAYEAANIFERFAALVAEKEREECAKVVWDMKGQCWAYDHDTIAAAIRAKNINLELNDERTI
jgi:hypothetical protein